MIDEKLIWAFDDIRFYARLLANKQVNSVIIAGDPGIGKTFNVKEELLKIVGEDKFRVYNSKATAVGLYKLLYENRKDGFLLLDDIDSVWKDMNAINILKAALDSYDKRIITYSAKQTFDPTDEDEEFIKEYIKRGKLPNKFDFNGGILFITNLYMRQLDSAVKSRSVTVELDLPNNDIFKLIESIKNKNEISKNKILKPMNVGPITQETEDKCLDIYRNKFNRKDEKPNIRTWKNMCIIWQASVSETDEQDAMRRVLAQIT